jgi:hypothetical protein
VIAASRSRTSFSHLTFQTPEHLSRADCGRKVVEVRLTVGGASILFAEQLFHSILNFGEGCTGTFFIEVAAWGAAHAEPGNRRSADHDRHSANCISDVG